MKKFIAKMLVAVMLVSSLSANAFAEESKAVYAKYIEGTQTDNYRVVIGWGEMKFTYSTADETWNTETHTWDKTGGGWSVNKTGDDKITITNHSSKDVTATFKFDATATGVNGAFSGENVKNNAVTVGNALDKTAKTVTVTFAPDGTLTKTTENAADFVKVGEITVTLD